MVELLWLHLIGSDSQDSQGTMCQLVVMVVIEDNLWCHLGAHKWQLVSEDDNVVSMVELSLFELVTQEVGSVGNCGSFLPAYSDTKVIIGINLSSDPKLKEPD